MKLTKEKAIKLHRELWDWLYHNPSKKKSDWPGWIRNGGSIGWTKHGCFPCGYKSQTGEGSCITNHRLCILDWSPTRCCFVNRGYFCLWDGASTTETRKKYAKIIRDLPETE